MKTAIYIEDGTIQLIITPTKDFEKNALSTFEDRELEVKIFSGSFYDCRGGWVRQSGQSTSCISRIDDKSIILTIKSPERE